MGVGTRVLCGAGGREHTRLTPQAHGKQEGQTSCV